MKRSLSSLITDTNVREFKAIEIEISAIKKSVTPLNTSVTGISFLTPATTKQFNPIGGVIRQTSAILTTIIPNHTLT
mgnify:CR=1 FL=1